MKRFNYIAIGLAILCFGGAVFATGITSKDMSPDVEKLISDRKSTRLNSSHTDISRMPSSA